MSDTLFDYENDGLCEGCNRPLTDGRCLWCDPATPYAGTSGWSGSDTSKARAVTADSDGTTSKRQAETIRFLAANEEYGVTVAELRDRMGWHHGQASGVLSVLHKEGVIARLSESRSRCKVYALPEYVNGRETESHGRNKHDPDHGTPVPVPATPATPDSGYPCLGCGDTNNDHSYRCPKAQR